jgi:hypothetical protein
VRAYVCPRLCECRSSGRYVGAGVCIATYRNLISGVSPNHIARMLSCLSPFLERCLRWDSIYHSSSQLRFYGLWLIYSISDIVSFKTAFKHVRNGIRMGCPRNAVVACPFATHRPSFRRTWNFGSFCAGAPPSEPSNLFGMNCCRRGNIRCDRYTRREVC